MVLQRQDEKFKLQYVFEPFKSLFRNFGFAQSGFLYHGESFVMGDVITCVHKYVRTCIHTCVSVRIHNIGIYVSIH